MPVPSAFRTRQTEYQVDVGYIAAFILVIALLAGVGYHLYSTTHISVADVEWPDPFGLNKTKTERNLAAAVGNLQGPLATATPASVTAASGPAAAAVAANTPVAASVPPSTIPLAALERAIMYPNDAAPASSARAQPNGIAQPTVTAVAGATAQGRLRVTNTSGDGVYIRRTPKMADRIVAWPDNTIVEFLGETSEGDGAKWSKVRDPRGNVGWIPSQYLSADTGGSTAMPPAGAVAPMPVRPGVVQPAAPVTRP